MWAIILSIAASVLVANSPSERSLGANVRTVYLHGAWVWTALVILLASGAAGLSALLTRQTWLHDWSKALGRTGLIFWITYLPLSMWAMETNWNGLYLAEPRWRLAVIFSITGLLLQIGLTLIDRPTVTSSANLLFIFVLLIAISSTHEIMHPRSPIFSSDSRLIQAYFSALVVLMLLIAWQITRSWLYFDRKPEKSI